MLKSIRIENLRSIGDSGFIDIKPLNILVGKNSSGKSTFLRTFPLMSQSVNKSLRGPISWFDSSFVDFGDYETAKNKFNDDNIKFSFKLKINDEMHYIPYHGNYYLRHFDIILVEICVSLANDSKGTFVNKISLILDGKTSIDMHVDKRDDIVQIKIDDVNLNSLGLKGFWDNETQRGILPSFTKNEVNDDFSMEALSIAAKLLKVYCNKRTSSNRILDFLTSNYNLNENVFLKNIKCTNIQTLAKNASDWTVKNQIFKNIYYLNVASLIEYIFRIIDDEFVSFFYECGYIAPFRAEATRYYRNQGLQVNDIDPYGRNLQEFISSLSNNSSRKSSFNEFTKKILGITVTVENYKGTQSLFIQDGTDRFNLADVGFGYSQILPIITKLWHLTLREDVRYRFPKFNSTRCTVIEQPELHLHPAMQARIADAFLYTIKICQKHDIDIRLIVETHSPTIINRLGRRVIEGVEDNNDIRGNISIIYFEKDDRTKLSKISSKLFKTNGQIENWPSGFFDPLDD